MDKWPSIMWAHLKNIYSACDSFEYISTSQALGLGGEIITLT